MTIQMNTPLLIIDVQRAFDDPKWGERNNSGAEENMKLLLQTWRESGRPVLFVQHRSVKEASLFHPHKPSFQFKEGFEPQDGEAIIAKTVNSSFIGTDLDERLKRLECKRLVIVGLTTNHCVETTTRMAGNLGYNPILVHDACATFGRLGPDGLYYAPEQIHNMTMVNLHEEFADIMSTAAVLGMV